jgi:threonyl-tRNA synthetase
MSYKNEIINNLYSAVRKVYPGAKLVFSEETQTGLYCDFDLPEPLNPSGFQAMKDALQAPCAPCVFELSSFSGVYRDGDKDAPMLQRVYVTAFDNEEAFEAHKEFLKAATESDHKKLGEHLSLFSSSEEVGQGLILWHPKGAMLRLMLEQFAQKMNILNGYEWVISPHIGKAALWQRSGHLSNFSDSMYNPIKIDNEEYYLKPMNCPFHILIYNSRHRSYRDLPVRYAEYGTVYRYELSGALNGLTRVRGFTQDDAHIICTPEQIEKELKDTLKLSLYTLASFGLTDYKIYVSTRPLNKSIGSIQDWETATELLKQAVLSLGLSYDIDEGGGAFYGPKIDIKLFDSLKREWQCSTIQFDFNLPGRFNMAYTGPDGLEHVPYMVHRALFGSIERFVALLIEHYKGDFPLWLSPVQVGLVPIRQEHIEYCRRLFSELQDKGLRVESNQEDLNMREKIKRFTQRKIPYILVAGDRDMAENVFSVRARHGIDLGQMNIDRFIRHLEPELAEGIAKRILDN